MQPPAQAGPTRGGYCPACRAVTPAGARFCGDCGAPLPQSCPACSEPVVPEQRFCTACGASLGPARLIRGGVTKGAAAGRRLMTVVFCDLVGSSALAARLDPEEFAALLVAYRGRCAAAVAHGGGYISSYVGDGVLACFGYPRAIGRDAGAAVACGLAITREISALATGKSLLGVSELAVRIGIETGIVVAGRLGPEDAMEFDALVGPAPYTAARLQELAPPNGVVIGEATHELVAEDFVCEELPPERLIRLQPPARAFVVRGEATRSGRRLVLARRGAPLVGRAAELTLIFKCWSRASDGKGQTVLLSGEAGIGKSRLAQELLDHIANQPHALIVLACVPPAAGTALYPAIEALREVLAITVGEAVGALTTMQALADLVEAIGLGGRPALALLARALALGPGPTDLAPTECRRLLLQALQAWLLHRAGEQPLLVLAEDLHWSDPSLLEMLRQVTEIIPNRQIMLLATYRTDLVLPWPDRSTTLRITLPPLERPDAEQLLSALASDQPVETREAILTRSDGVPLFLEEFTLAAGAPSVPRSLQQLFTARLDSLGETKRLAQCAAILAPQLEPDLLGALAELPDDLVEGGVTRLVDMEVLVRTRAFPGAVAYGFRHALLQQAASESVLAADRRALHARAAALLARLRPALIERQPEVLAEHHVLGGEFAAALPLYASAARRALASAALEEAEALVRRGLLAAAALPPAEAAETDLDLRVLLGHVLIAKRGYANAAVQEAFEGALCAAERVRDEVQALPALRGLASFYQVRGPLSHAEVICNRLVAAVESTGDPRLLVDAWRRRGWNRGCMGRLAEAEQDLARALNAFDPTRLEEHIATAGHDPQVLALANLCWLAPPQHGLAVAAERAAGGDGAARRAKNPVSACYGLVFAALVLQQAGQLDEALRLADRALAVAGEKGFAYWVAMGKVAVGYDQVVRRGDLAAGREVIRIGMASYRETQGELLRPFILSLLAEAEAALGEVEAAQAAIREATDVATVLEARGFLPGLLLRQAQLLTGTASRAQLRELLERALGVARAQGAEAMVRTVTDAMSAL
jgi:class 3 adenylate cyclase/tetratricopeptide (TPR) repeat protein